jgi:hypothetical protein
MKKKQFTIIVNGNRFGEYYVNGLNEEGYFSKWRITYNYYPEYEEYKLFNVENIDYNLRPYEIKKQTISRTKEWYDKIKFAKGDYPYWFEELEKEVSN